MSLHISLYLYQNFLLISSPLHHHHRRPSCSSPPRSFDFVAFFTTVTLITNTTGHLSLSLSVSYLSLFSSHLSILSSNRFCFFTDLRRRSSGVTERHLRLSVVRQRCKAGSLLLVRGRWLKLCEGGDGG
ncbi:unnamed protein product [Brassica rapa]|uniref:Uncharacterized protein n=1 Tax=Brassica campestris TaxID=3711 RepID=A0A3P5YK40_BRACM|nr:unnamed protein product [Brassica rapa]VDC64034.1 unnamed protein product [Brassica rapa]